MPVRGERYCADGTAIADKGCEKCWFCHVRDIPQSYLVVVVAGAARQDPTVGGKRYSGHPTGEAEGWRQVWLISSNKYDGQRGEKEGGKRSARQNPWVMFACRASQVARLSRRRLLTPGARRSGRGH